MKRSAILNNFIPQSSALTHRTMSTATIGWRTMDLAQLWAVSCRWRRDFSSSDWVARMHYILETFSIHLSNLLVVRAIQCLSSTPHTSPTTTSPGSPSRTTTSDHYSLRLPPPNPTLPYTLRKTQLQPSRVVSRSRRGPISLTPTRYDQV
jgi:hypothetical protein